MQIRHLLPVFAFAAVSGWQLGPQASAQPAPQREAGSQPVQQQPVEQQPVQQQGEREGRARFTDPSDGQFDLSYFLEKPRGFLPIPLVITEPAVGYGGGGAGMFLRPRREAGEQGFARPNISAIGAFATQNGTRGAFAGDASRWLDDRLRTLVGGGTGQVNLDFYGLGADRSSLDQKVRYSLQFTGIAAQANWQLAPKSPWAVGLRFVYADVTPKLRDEPTFPGLVDRVRVKVAAPTAVLEFDTRDNIFTPTRGVYTESSLLASREALGATDDFERFQLTLIGWWPIARNVTLGARANYAWSSAGTPFFLRPYIQLRGVPAVRYQGDEAASFEIETRWQFHGRWSVIGFAGIGASHTMHGAFDATQNTGSGGVGLRYELASKFGMHVGIDVAQSRGTTAVYFQVGNAWFRP